MLLDRRRIWKFAKYTVPAMLMLALLVIAFVTIGGIAMVGELAVGLFVAAGVAVGSRVWRSTFPSLWHAFPAAWLVMSSSP